ncbi:hypothetical protein F5B21DRAFT_500963 [Xylaria acuta]|nr:hypothetical protein F5B21DRAFT_500963 [Xylaria acuta]
MQVKAIIVSLFLAATVAAAPTGPNTDSFNGIGNGNSFSGIGNGIGKDTQNNPSVGNDNASRNGNGNTVGSNNDLNFYGETSRQVSQEVVAAMKSLALTCRSSNGEGVMSCTWKS